MKRKQPESKLYLALQSKAMLEAMKVKPKRKSKK